MRQTYVETTGIVLVQRVLIVPGLDCCFGRVIPGGKVLAIWTARMLKYACFADTLGMHGQSAIPLQRPGAVDGALLIVGFKACTFDRAAARRAALLFLRGFLLSLRGFLISLRVVLLPRRTAIVKTGVRIGPRPFTRFGKVVISLYRIGGIVVDGRLLFGLLVMLVAPPAVRTVAPPAVGTVAIVVDTGLN